MFELIVVILVIVIIAFILFGFKISNYKKAMSEYIENIPEFSSTNEFIGSNALTGIAYDDKQKKVCLVKRIGREPKHRLFSYRDILSSEIIEDGNSITKTARGSQIGGALVGGVALGPVGLLLGGLSGKKKFIDKVNRIDLQIIVNDAADPRHIINFLNFETEKAHPFYNSLIEEARQWHAIINVLIKKADNEDENNITSNMNNTANTFSISDELKKLSALRDSGILTESEFQQQKRKLLNQ